MNKPARPCKLRITMNDGSERVRSFATVQNREAAIEAVRNWYLDEWAQIICIETWEDLPPVVRQWDPANYKPLRLV